MPPQIGAPPDNARRTGSAGTEHGHLRIVWNKERAEPKAARPPSQLTAQDRRFLSGLSRWPLPLTAAQWAWLRYLAGGGP
jgi:hypothetical protein